jgi:protein TonB
MSARRNGYQGTAVVELLVDPSGTITSAKIQKSSGFPLLDQSALDTVKKRWHFPPGQQRWLSWSCIFQLQ